MSADKVSSSSVKPQGIRGAAQAAGPLSDPTSPPTNSPITAVPAQVPRSAEGLRRRVALGDSRRVDGWWARSQGMLYIFAIEIVAIAVALLLVRSGFSGALMLTAVITLFSMAALNLYRSKFTMSVLDDLPRLVLAVLAGYGISSGVAFLWERSGFLLQVQFALLLLLTLFIGRTISYFLVRHLRRRRTLSATALIVGAGEVSAALGTAMKILPEAGLELIGFADPEPALPAHALPAPVLGSTDDLAQLLHDYRPNHVIIGFSLMPESQLIELVRMCDREESEISVVPRLFEMTARTGDSDELNGLPLTRLRRATFRSPSWLLKRGMDIAVSSIALLLLSPLLGLIALMDRLVDGPGIIFRQQRVGIDGKGFEVLKFRSMRPATSEEGQTQWNIKNDDRVSWLGKSLRKSSMDELPQLWNILRGDMSLVGPRPERPHFTEIFRESYPRYDGRHRVPCGLTGWAQIHGLRGDTSISERARFDNYYIENWSLWLDIKIILRTFGTLTKGSG